MSIFLNFLAAAAVVQFTSVPLRAQTYDHHSKRAAKSAKSRKLPSTAEIAATPMARKGGKASPQIQGKTRGMVTFERPDKHLRERGAQPRLEDQNRYDYFLGG
jgi:hypothetical protein